MKTYHGKQNVNKVGPIDIFVTENDQTRKLVHIVRHSPDGFQIGYGGSGPADTALSILNDCLGKEQANVLYQSFKWDLVAGWQEEFSITEMKIKEWAKEEFKKMNLTRY